ncbi:hypothetical protein EFW17_05390 [Halostreptopolyspora alba]|uniref:Uncharacterized protein n=1 Tax=Halostreptopolyspora alba TaxID=2487137 RepID=A0A3N0EFH2_9ACTN|nr:hypothetical protein EFW17_05390 [Nocardiopsaceae bacterium YIM 96095]
MKMVSWMTTGRSAMGSTCRTSRIGSQTPESRALSTKSFSRTASTPARVSWAMFGARTSPTATIDVTRPDPSAPVIATASTSSGNAIMMSETRMSTVPR